MRPALTVALIAVFAIAGCSRGGPGIREGIFGVPRNATVDPNSGAPNGLIPQKESVISGLRSRGKIYAGTPVDQITSVVTEPSNGGVIVRVTGLPLRDGAFDVRLTSSTDYEPVNGVMTYTLEAVQPVDTAQTPEYMREVTTGVFLPHRTLNKISTIQILGARNQRALKR